MKIENVQQLILSLYGLGPPLGVSCRVPPRLQRWGGRRTIRTMFVTGSWVFDRFSRSSQLVVGLSPDCRYVYQILLRVHQCCCIRLINILHFITLFSHLHTVLLLHKLIAIIKKK